MLRFPVAPSASLVARNGLHKLGMRAPRAASSSATVSASVSSMLSRYTALLDGFTLKNAYTSTIALLNGITKAGLPRAASPTIGPHLASHAHPRPKPLTAIYVPRRIYCSKIREEGTVLRTKRVEDEVRKIRRSSRRPRSWYDVTLKLSAMLLNGTSVWYLHSSLHKENPTWVSYLSFVPVLNWLPVLDLAQLDRIWFLVPAVVFTILLRRRAVLTFVSMWLLLGVEFFRNYHLLRHLEAFSWPLFFAWTFFRTEWLFVSFLSILGPEQYQLVPHRQRGPIELLGLVGEKLDATLVDPSIIDGNVPLFFLHLLWKYMPFIREVSAYVNTAYSSSGTEAWVESVSDQVSSLFNLNTTTSTTSTKDTRPERSDDKQKPS